MTFTAGQVLAYRATSCHLDTKLAAGSLAAAAWGGLQDSIPRAGVIGLHARVHDVAPASWNDPTLCQIWFRGGADYIVPRADVAPFTLGSRPRDAARCAAIDALADRVVALLDGRELKVREVTDELALDHPITIRSVARSGRLLIRWNASMIWLYECPRPDVDDEDARLALARRFLRWFGPQTRQRFAWWAGLEPADAIATWSAIAPELTPVNVDEQPRDLLAVDRDELLGAEPLSGVRLLHNDDPWLKADHDLHGLTPRFRDWLWPPIGSSPGYIPGAVVVDGRIVGVWQRQQRKVTIHPWRRLPNRTVDAIEAEAFAFPIAAKSSGKGAPSVSWDRG